MKGLDLPRSGKSDLAPFCSNNAMIQMKRGKIRGNFPPACS